MTTTRCAAALTLALLAASVSTPVGAQAAAVLQPAQSEIVFTSTQMGVPVDGRFRRFDAQVALNPRQAESGQVVLSIDTASATLGLPDTDAELPKANWFASAQFPQATFRSTTIKALGGGRFEVAGELAIKGRTQALTVPVQVTQSGSTSVATGRFSIRRLAFRIGEAEWADTALVADDVAVRFKLVFTGLAPL